MGETICSAQMKVLIVDDNRGLASLIQLRLEREGHKVRTAVNGRDGYATYQILAPDLIISDIFMPEENGLDMMKRIRSHDPQVKTIYMTGDLNPFRRALEEEQKRYPVRFVQKPFSTKEISEMISALVGAVNRGGDF
ncbi:MAG: response regulator [Deltaproteobacteria bacterium]|nr:response regulator [Deltaproteobacteria bacterium]